MMETALVLFSGGQDSTTCLYWAKSKCKRVEAIGFNYGQKHDVELKQAAFIAQLAGVPFEVVEITGILRGSALTEHDKDVSAQHELNPELPASVRSRPQCLVLNHRCEHRNDEGDTRSGWGNVPDGLFWVPRLPPRVCR